LYVVEQWSMADLTARYQVGSPTVLRWLLAAGIEIRRRGSGGFRRHLTARPRRELFELGQGLSAPAIARRLGVDPATVGAGSPRPGSRRRLRRPRTGPVVRRCRFCGPLSTGCGGCMCGRACRSPRSLRVWVRRRIWCGRGCSRTASRSGRPVPGMVSAARVGCGNRHRRPPNCDAFVSRSGSPGLNWPPGTRCTRKRCRNS